MYKPTVGFFFEYVKMRIIAGVDMFGGEVASTRLLQGVGCMLKPADGLYMRCELNQISLVQLVKARGIRTVDIQNADDAPLMVKRDDDLAWDALSQAIWPGKACTSVTR